MKNVEHNFSSNLKFKPRVSKKKRKEKKDKRMEFKRVTIRETARFENLSCLD